MGEKTREMIWYYNVIMYTTRYTSIAFSSSL